MSGAGAKVRPIIFSAPLVRALLEGRKTVTRRPMKPQPCGPVRFDTAGDPYDEASGALLRHRYGASGDRLYVREAFRPALVDGEWSIQYRAGGFGFVGDLRCAMFGIQTTPAGVAVAERQLAGERVPEPWRPSIHMPGWASRIILEVTEVRVERLAGITATDVHSEGIEADCRASDVTLLDRFARAWDGIYAKRPEFRWAADPWVWVVRFVVAQSGEADG